MAKDRFANLDLNLLRTFLVLSQELNMRKASTRLHVTQPAISQALQKLRRHFDDELFVKVRSGLEATPYAIELAATIAPFLDGIADAVNQLEEFSADEVEHVLPISLIPVLESALAGRMYHAIQSSAPKAKLELKSWNGQIYQQLIAGQVLIAVGYEQHGSKEIYSEQVAELEGKIIARRGHPLSNKRLKVEDLEGATVANFVTQGWNDNHSHLVEVFKRHGVNLNVGIRSELIMPLLDILHHTDMILAHSNLFPLQQYSQLVALDIDMDIPERKVIVYIHYHVRYRNSPMIQWLKLLIEQQIEQQINDNHSLYAK
ncbi:LysR family transcriptional regulator [Vibrio superstes]|uniref:LysR family transcriptional regulator n=1 Tax=Vibrio superstes NBRC 103154 TaxID=1219062 RepID=A0A511QLU7_9VIBR|nr:LysR family transcriptional regulator [Vibrio superstes]GEM78300.1 LysR family transcriptional regulator [Vibrio superstes NBRC 103154]